MQNAEQLDAVYKTASESMGSAQQEQEAYMESIEGRMNALVESARALFMQFVNSDTIKGFISALNGLVKVVSTIEKIFGSLGTTIGTITTLFLLFTKNPLKSFVAGIVRSGTVMTTFKSIASTLVTTIRAMTVSMGSGATASMVLATGFKALGNSAIFATIKTYALQMALSFGIGIAITAVIGAVVGLVKAIGGFIDSLIMTKDELKEFSAELITTNKEIGSSVSSAEKLKSEMDSLNKQISETDDLEKRAELQQQLTEKQVEMAETLPETVTGLNDQGQAIAGNNGLIEQSIALKKQEMELNALKYFEENRELSDLAGQYERVLDKRNKINLALAKSGGKDTSYQDENGMKVQVDKDDLSEANKELQEIMTTIAETSTMYGYLGEAGKEAFSYIGDELTDANELMNQTKDSAYDLGNTTLDPLEKSVEDVTESVKGLSESFDEAGEKIELLNLMQKDMNELGQLTKDTASKVLASGDTTLIAMLGDEANLLSNINSELEVQKQLEREAYEEAIRYAQSVVQGEANKANASKASADARINNENAVVNNNNTANEIDSKNFTSLQKSKVDAQGNLVVTMDRQMASMVNNNNAKYKIDAQNYANATNSKIKNNNDLVASMNGLNKGLDAGLDLIKKANTAKLTESTYGGDTVGYDGSLVGYEGVRDDGKGSSSKKQEKEYTAKLEQWYKLTEAIERNSDALSTNKSLLEKSTGEETNRLQKERIELLKKQMDLEVKLQREQQKTLEQYRNELKKNGAIFEGDTIANYDSLLGGTRTGASAEALEHLDDLVQKFEDLKDTIASTNDAWYKYDKEYRDILKEQAEFVADQEQQIYELAKYYAEKTTKAKQDAIDEQLEAMEKLKNEEENEDDIKQRQKELLEIQAEMDKFANAVDANGRARYQQLKKDYEDQLAELNKIIQENQYEYMTDRMEEEKEQLDKDLEELLSPTNINKIIAEAMETGMMNIMGETIDVQKAMGDMLKETEIGLMNTTLQWKEMKDEIAQVRDLYDEISSLTSTLGVSDLYGQVSQYGEQPKMNRNSTELVSEINLTVNGSASQQDKDSFEKATRRIVREENQKLLNKLSK